MIWTTHVEAEDKVTLRPTVSRPVSLGVRCPSGTSDQFYFLLESFFRQLRKLLLYKSILKQIWTYSNQLWGTASTSNIEILERYQSKALRIIVDVL
jgi:hypothetical protein